MTFCLNVLYVMKTKTAIQKNLYFPTLPGRPWEKIGTDLFHYNGAEHLLCVDYYYQLLSKYPEITKLCDTASRGVITAMKSTFARHGIPVSVVSDNGPQYDSGEFSVF